MASVTTAAREKVVRRTLRCVAGEKIPPDITTGETERAETTSCLRWQSSTVERWFFIGVSVPRTRTHTQTHKQKCLLLSLSQRNREEGTQRLTEQDVQSWTENVELEKRHTAVEEKEESFSGSERSTLWGTRSGTRHLATDAAIYVLITGNWKHFSFQTAGLRL